MVFDQSKNLYPADTELLDLWGEMIESLSWIREMAKSPGFKEKCVLWHEEQYNLYEKLCGDLGNLLQNTFVEIGGKLD
jgi:hypothetical protein